MTDVREATETLLADKPDLEAALRDLLALDADGPWTFDDTGLDSGTFGEIVSRGIVEEVDDGYRIADREALQVALAGEDVETAGDGTSAGRSLSVADGLTGLTERVDRRTTLALVGALLVVLLARVVLMWNAVYQNGDIVLAGNDPYLYRYWGEQLVASDFGLLDLGSLSEVSSRIPGHDTLYVVAVWWASSLLGGDAPAVGTMLAWTPVLLGVLTALLVYLLSVRLTADRRIALSAVLLLAFTPTHAYRTALGFGDHHAFDYLWVALTALSLVALVGAKAERDDFLPTSRGEWLAVIGVAVGIAAQAHSWRGGPLLSIPVGIYLAGRVALDVRDGRSPLAGSVPVLLGLGIGALLALLPHLLFGWAPFYRAFAPTLLLVGGVVVVGVGVIADRVGLDARLLVGGEIVAGLVALGVAFVALPEFSSAFDQLVAYFVEYGQSGIAETYSIFSGEAGSVIGPVLLFGFVFFLAVPYMLWGVGIAVSRSRPDWLAATTYGLYFLLLAVVQSRFAGQLSLFTAVFGGVGFLHLATLVEVADRPAVLESGESALDDVGRQRGLRSEPRSVLNSTSIPNGRTLGTLAVLFLLVSSLGVVQTGVKQSQIAVGEDIYETAIWVEGYEDQDGSARGDYVFSSWGRNRVYNYFVNGDSQSYTFARDNYAEFLGSTEPGEWRSDLNGQNTGYVVIREPPTDVDPRSMSARLYNRFGSRTEDISATTHYRLIHAQTEDAVRVFEFVPGARVVGQAAPNSSVTLSTTVDVGGRTVEYERQTETTMNGWYVATVPYAGNYETGNVTYGVSDSDIKKGGFADDRGPNATWHFNEGRGTVLFDARGGHHANGENLSWRASPDGRSLDFDGTSSVVVENATGLDGEDGFTVSAWFRTNDSTAQFAKIVSHDDSTFYRETKGYQIGLNRGRLFAGLGDGEQTALLGGPRVVDGMWHRTTLVWDGETARLYLDGKEVNRRQFSGSLRDDGNLSIGANTGGSNDFVGAIDEVQYEANSLSPETIRRSYTNSSMITG